MRPHVSWIWFALSLLLVGCNSSDPASLQQSRFDYGLAEKWPRCGPNKGLDIAARRDDYMTARGVRYNVRAPSNYNPRYQHPLIMVYAAGGQKRLIRIYCVQRAVPLTSRAETNAQNITGASLVINNLLVRNRG